MIFMPSSAANKLGNVDLLREQNTALSHHQAPPEKFTGILLKVNCRLKK
jgi:hypothetical protein